MEIEGHPDYLIYDDGRVFSKKSRKMLKPQKNSHGHYFIHLKRSGNTIPSLVARAYLPNDDPTKKEVICIDGDLSNFHVSNLRWATRSEVLRDTKIHKNNKLGIKNICYHKVKSKYVYKKVIRGKAHERKFDTLDEAIAYKQKYETLIASKCSI